MSATPILEGPLAEAASELNSAPYGYRARRDRVIATARAQHVLDVARASRAWHLQGAS